MPTERGLLKEKEELMDRIKLLEKWIEIYKKWQKFDLGDNEKEITVLKNRIQDIDSLLKKYAHIDSPGAEKNFNTAQTQLTALKTEKQKLAQQYAEWEMFNPTDVEKRLFDLDNEIIILEEGILGND